MTSAINAGSSAFPLGRQASYIRMGGPIGQELNIDSLPAGSRLVAEQEDLGQYGINWLVLYNPDGTEKRRYNVLHLAVIQWREAGS